MKIELNLQTRDRVFRHSSAGGKFQRIYAFIGDSLIDLYLRHGLVEQSKPLFEKLEAVDKNMAANAYFMLGNLYFTHKDFANAEIAYKKSIELNNKIFQAFHNLGVVCAAQNKKADAKIYLEKFLEMAPESDMVPNAKKILNDIK